MYILFAVVLHEQDQLNFIAWFEDALKFIEQSREESTALNLFAIEASDNESVIDKGELLIPTTRRYTAQPLDRH